MKRVDRGDHYRRDFNRGLARAQRWEEWINLLAGIWLFISPWLLNYSGTRNALWDAVIIGAVVVILAAWDLIAMQRTVHHHA